MSNFNWRMPLAFIAVIIAYLDGWSETNTGKQSSFETECFVFILMWFATRRSR